MVSRPGVKILNGHLLLPPGTSLVLDAPGHVELADLHITGEGPPALSAAALGHGRNMSRQLGSLNG